MKISSLALVACMSLALGSASGAIAQTNGGTMPNSAPAPASPAAAQLPSDRPIGRIEPVFEFHDAMPTGVTVAADGRIFINSNDDGRPHCNGRPLLDEGFQR